MKGEERWVGSEWARIEATKKPRLKGEMQFRKEKERKVKRREARGEVDRERKVDKRERGGVAKEE